MIFVNLLLNLQGIYIFKKKPLNILSINKGALDCIVYGFTNREFRQHFIGKYAFFQVLFSPFLLLIAVFAAMYP
jgi:hypothetical protein